MRTPDRHTTETHKRPATQIVEQLARNARPLKPHMAHSKKRQMGDRKTVKAAAGPGKTVKPGLTVVQRILNKGDNPIAKANPMALGHSVMQKIISRA